MTSQSILNSWMIDLILITMYIVSRTRMVVLYSLTMILICWFPFLVYLQTNQMSIIMRRGVVSLKFHLFGHWLMDQEIGACLVPDNTRGSLLSPAPYAITFLLVAKIPRIVVVIEWRANISCPAAGRQDPPMGASMKDWSD